MLPNCPGRRSLSIQYCKWRQAYDNWISSLFLLCFYARSYDHILPCLVMSAILLLEEQWPSWIVGQGSSIERINFPSIILLAQLDRKSFKGSLHPNVSNDKKRKLRHAISERQVTRRNCAGYRVAHELCNICSRNKSSQRSLLLRKLLAVIQQRKRTWAQILSTGTAQIYRTLVNSQPLFLMTVKLSAFLIQQSWTALQCQQPLTEMFEFR